MNIIVCVKQVPDSETRVKIGADGKSIDPAGVNFVINPYDEYAIEEAIRIKEKAGGEITILTLGTERAVADIRKALAMGADKAVLIKVEEGADVDVAYCLAEQIRKMPHDLILFGKQAIDNDSGQAQGMVAEYLDLPSTSVAVKIEIEGQKCTVEREIEGGKEIVEMALPAVISAEKGLNEPRLPNLKGIMMAKKKPLEEVVPAASKDKVEVIGLELPPPRNAGKIVKDVDELVNALHNEAKVI